MNRPKVPGRRTERAIREDHGGVPEVDPELLAVLRLLQAAFGDVEVLEIIDETPAATPPAAQGWLFNEEGDDDEPGWMNSHEQGEA